MVKSANLTEEQLARIFELSPVTSIPKENFTETLFDMAGEKQKKDVAHRVVASLVEAGGFGGLFENSGGGCVTKESVDNILKELQSGQFLYD